MLHSHAPLDLVILMLGTNDLKTPDLPAAPIAATKGMQRLVEIIRNHAWPFGFEDAGNSDRRAAAGLRDGQ